MQQLILRIGGSSGLVVGKAELRLKELLSLLQLKPEKTKIFLLYIIYTL
jgi:hypothetical protein